MVILKFVSFLDVKCKAGYTRSSKLIEYACASTFMQVYWSVQMTKLHSYFDVRKRLEQI